MIIGIDYSMTSPAVCLHRGKTWSFRNCEFHFFHKERKADFSRIRNGSTGLHPYEYPMDLDPGTERFDFLSDWVMRILNEHDKMGTVWMEGYSYGSKGSRVFEIGENSGILKLKLFSNGIPFRVVPPTVIKKHATGKGNADKRLLEETFVSETELDLRTLLNQTKKQFNPSSDVVDSYYACRYGFQQYSDPPEATNLL